MGKIRPIVRDEEGFVLNLDGTRRKTCMSEKQNKKEENYAKTGHLKGGFGDYPDEMI